MQPTNFTITIRVEFDKPESQPGKPNQPEWKTRIDKAEAKARDALNQSKGVK